MASMTDPGTWVPPGASRKSTALPACSSARAGKRDLSAATSSSDMPAIVAVPRWRLQAGQHTQRQRVEAVRLVEAIRAAAGHIRPAVLPDDAPTPRIDEH